MQQRFGLGANHSLVKLTAQKRHNLPTVMLAGYAMVRGTSSLDSHRSLNEVIEQVNSWLLEMFGATDAIIEMRPSPKLPIPFSFKGLGYLVVI